MGKYMPRLYEDVGALINDFVGNGEAIARSLAKRHSLPIECVHIQNALVEVLAVETATDLLDLGLTKESMISALENYEFRKLFPTLSAEVTFERSIIPHGVPQYLAEQTVRYRGQVWRIYRNDADPFPSNPHAHNLESGHKLHLGTGELFRKRQVVGNISRKDLLALRERLFSFELPPLVS
jgi:hypothetical protein